MTQHLELKGYWWLPTNPQEQLAGILTYHPHEKISLEIIGAFNRNHPEQLFAEHIEQQEIIHGITSDAQEITLINCHPSTSWNLSVNFPMTKYRCQYLLVGQHINEINQAKFFKAHVSIPVLDQWCPPHTIRTTLHHKKNDAHTLEKTTLEIYTNTPPISKVELNENTTLSLVSAPEYHLEPLSPTIRQRTFIEIQKKKDTTIKDILADIHLYEQFLTLATLQNVQCNEITLFDKTYYQNIHDGDKHYHPIKLIYIQQNNNTPQRNKTKYLFTYSTIAPQYPEIIKRWYQDKEPIAPIRTHLVQSIAPIQNIFTSIDYLIVIQALEGFWWRFRDEAYKQKNNIPKGTRTNLKNLIIELKKEYEDIVAIAKTEIDIEAAVDSRHYYSHFVNKSQKPHTLDGFELYKLTQQLRLLLICCLLNFIGFNPTTINQILNESESDLVHLE